MRTDRLSLNFEPVALNAFAFLADLGFLVVRSEPTLVRFESSNRVVSVFHGRSSYQVGTEIGRWVSIGIVRHEQSFSLPDILALLGKQDVIDIERLSATSPERVASLVTTFAQATQEFALPLLTNGDELFQQLSTNLANQSDKYLEELRASRLREQAEEAWRSKDYATVISLYRTLDDDLRTIELTKTERGRLRYAERLTR